jgi:DNA-binding GntR family transcriptional regulator
MSNVKYKYKKIEKYILDNIYKGNLLSGSLLPTQKQLCIKFGASRMTVMKALNSLEDAGFIERIQGSGTYVKTANLHEQSIEMLSFTEQYSRRGIRVKSDLISYEKMVIPSVEMANKLKVSKKENIHFVKRLRYGNDKPMAMQYLYISTSRVPVLDLNSMSGSFYSYIEKVLKKKLGNGQSNLTVVLPPEEVRKYLNLQENTPVVCTKHITCFANGLPFEFIVTYQCYETYSMDFFNNRLF